MSNKEDKWIMRSLVRRLLLFLLPLSWSINERTAIIPLYSVNQRYLVKSGGRLVEF